MDLYASLMVALVCLSTVNAECPDNCTCDTIRITTDVLLDVRCDNLQHFPLEVISSDVTELVIVDNNITVLPNIDKHVENITQLKVLVLSKNHISKIEIDSLRVFTSLKLLDISINNISNIPNELFKTLPNLKELFLSFNQHLILPADNFGTKELEYLDIAYCNLKEIPLKFFDSMPNILELHLEGNHISYLGPHLISAFREMLYINLKQNNLTAFQPELFSLLIEHDVRFATSGNPFRCDCQFKEGLNWIPFPSMTCVLPTGSNDNDSVDQEEYLNTLDCDVTKSEAKTITTNTSTSISSINLNSYNNSNESTNLNNTKLDNGDSLAAKNHTALWIVLGIVVFIVFFVAIVASVRNRTLGFTPK